MSPLVLPINDVSSCQPSLGLKSLYGQLPSQEEAREGLHRLGVPWDYLTEALDHGGDLVHLLCKLEELGFLCGRAGLHWFLTNPCAALGWRTPANALARSGGIEEVERAISQELRPVIG
jgi:hypothetical protein